MVPQAEYRAVAMVLAEAAVGHAREAVGAWLGLSDRGWRAGAMIRALPHDDRASGVSPDYSRLKSNHGCNTDEHR